MDRDQPRKIGRIEKFKNIRRRHRRSEVRGDMMKLIKAIIRPERFDFVKKALEDRGLYAMTVTEVMGRGEQRGISLKYRGGIMAVELLPKILIEVVVRDSEEEGVLTAIETAAKTGKIGDGKIFVIRVERSVRVRTGEVEA